MSDAPARRRLELVRRALTLLGKKKLLLSIHDPSFPGDADEDLGRGSPYSRAGRRFLEFARDLGFTGIQLGPQGQTSRGNPSPYDGTVFSRNSLSIDLASLAGRKQWSGLLSGEELAEELSRRSSRDRARVRHVEAFDAHRRLLWKAYDRFATRDPSTPELAEFTRRNRHWLEADSLYEALSAAHGSEDWRSWPEKGSASLDRRVFQPGPGEKEPCRLRRREAAAIHARAVVFYRFCQFVAHRQHEHLRETARSLGLEPFADLQIGLSSRDVWALQGLFLPGYLLGAPPSRTNPEGQPWGYPVFDPGQITAGPHGPAGPVVRFMRRRFAKLLGEYDGLRIDHPQGLVCPWVYRADDPDRLHAVQSGARLYASPDLPDHPALRRFAVARPEQLGGPLVRRWDDGWVRSLDPEQVERYGILMGILVETALSHGRDTGSIACEILSTLPYPLARVIRRYRLGRFRVTQKADLDNPADVYRSENAEERDWIMLGTHDSPPIWRVAERWVREGQAPGRAAYLAGRLASTSERPAWEAELRRSPARLVHAQLADALASRAEQALVFFTDLFGIREAYNTPGSVGPDNWSLRVPEDYLSSYPQRSERLEALNLPYALSIALSSPPRGPAAGRTTLAAELRKLSGVP